MKKEKLSLSEIVLGQKAVAQLTAKKFVNYEIAVATISKLKSNEPLAKLIDSLSDELLANLINSGVIKANAVKITKEEYHANKKRTNGTKNPHYFCTSIYIGNGSYNGYSYKKFEYSLPKAQVIQNFRNRLEQEA